MYLQVEPPAKRVKVEEQTTLVSQLNQVYELLKRKMDPSPPPPQPTPANPPQPIPPNQPPFSSEPATHGQGRPQNRPFRGRGHPPLEPRPPCRAYRPQHRPFRGRGHPPPEPRPPCRAYRPQHRPFRGRGHPPLEPRPPCRAYRPQHRCRGRGDEEVVLPNLATPATLKQ